MNITQLEEFLYTKTEGEKWHINNPGKLSSVYKDLKIYKKKKKECYRFDFEHTIKDNKFAIVKESRFTTIPRHFHKNMEINYIYCGECLYEVAGEKIHLSQGDLFLIDSNVIHSAISIKNENDIVINLIFRKDFFDSTFLSRLPGDNLLTHFLYNSISTKNEHDQFLIIKANNDEKIHTIIQYLLCAYYDPVNNIDHLVQNYLSIFFLELINSIIFNYSSIKYRLNTLPIIKYIEKNSSSCTLTEVAQVFNYTPTYLSYLIRNELNSTFSKIKLNQQLLEASFLLTSTNKNIREIVNKIGMTNVNYFYKKFFELYKMTPKEFRNKNK